MNRRCNALFFNIIPLIDGQERRLLAASESAWLGVLHGSGSQRCSALSHWLLKRFRSPGRMAYHYKTARNAACSWSPSTDVANRWLAVSLATSERSRLVKAPDRVCSIVQVQRLVGHDGKAALERFHSPGRMANHCY